MARPAKTSQPLASGSAAVATAAMPSDPSRRHDDSDASVKNASSKKRRGRRKALTVEEDIAILRAVLALRPQHAGHGHGRRRWQETANRVTMEVGSEISTTLCKGRFDNLLKRFVLAHKAGTVWPPDATRHELIVAALEEQKILEKRKRTASSGSVLAKSIKPVSKDHGDDTPKTTVPSTSLAATSGQPTPTVPTPTPTPTTPTTPTPTTAGSSTVVTTTPTTTTLPAPARGSPMMSRVLGTVSVPRAVPMTTSPVSRTTVRVPGRGRVARTTPALAMATTASPSTVTADASTPTLMVSGSKPRQRMLGTTVITKQPTTRTSSDVAAKEAIAIATPTKPTNAVAASSPLTAVPTSPSVGHTASTHPAAEYGPAAPAVPAVAPAVVDTSRKQLEIGGCLSNGVMQPQYSYLCRKLPIPPRGPSLAPAGNEKETPSRPSLTLSNTATQSTPTASPSALTPPSALVAYPHTTATAAGATQQPASAPASASASTGFVGRSIRRGSYTASSCTADSTGSPAASSSHSQAAPNVPPRSVDHSASPVRRPSPRSPAKGLSRFVVPYPTEAAATSADERRPFAETAVVTMLNHLTEMERSWLEDRNRDREFRLRTLSIRSPSSEASGASGAVDLTRVEFQELVQEVIVSRKERFELKQQVASLTAALEASKREHVHVSDRVESLLNKVEEAHHERAALQHDVASLVSVLEDVPSYANRLRELEGAQQRHANELRRYQQEEEARRRVTQIEERDQFEMLYQRLARLEEQQHSSNAEITEPQREPLLDRHGTGIIVGERPLLPYTRNGQPSKKPRTFNPFAELQATLEKQQELIKLYEQAQAVQDSHAHTELELAELRTAIDVERSDRAREYAALLDNIRLIVSSGDLAETSS